MALDSAIGATLVVLAGALVPAMILARLTRTDMKSILMPTLVGGGLLTVTLLVQPLLQVVPARLIELQGFPLALYAALVSGLVQESLKFLGVSRFRAPMGAWVGLGFGAAESSLVAVSIVIGSIGGLLFGVGLLILSAYERLLATTFHVATALLLTYENLPTLLRLSVAVALHTSLNLVALAYRIGRGPPSTIDDGLAVMYVAITIIVFLTITLSVWGSTEWRKVDTSGMGS